MVRKKTVLTINIFLIILFSLFIITSHKENIPCLLFHSVLPNTRVSPESFEKILIWLKENGYESFFISDLLKIKNSQQKKNSKAIILTFDDGYIDNFSHAYPLLKKYGFKATIFIITSKISANPKNGYLSWKQLEEMIKSGHVEVQSHSHTHRYCYISDKINAFNSPIYLWYVKEYSPDGDIRLGIPLYERKSSLVTKCYCDDYNLRNYISKYIENRGGSHFFKEESGSEKELFKLVKNYLNKKNLIGYYESDLDYERRVMNELVGSKTVIERKLRNSCIAIAWPWGQYTEELITKADIAGYRICVTADRGTNYIGGIDLNKVKRIEAQEYGIEKLILGRLSLSNSIRIRFFIYDHYLLGYIYNLINKIKDGSIK